MDNHLPQQKMISFTTKDKLILEGCAFCGSKKNNSCVIHVHGLAGNFYHSNLIHSMIKPYSKAGYDLITFNNRGAEYIKKFNKDDGSKELIGYTFENFTDCIYDIAAAVQYAKSKYNKIILQGHSSGCQKIVYALSKIKITVDAVILISPCDDIGLAQNSFGLEKFKTMIEFAKNNKETLLPLDFFFNIPISNKTFLSHFGEDNKFDIFHYYDTTREFVELAKNELPTAVFFGDHDLANNLPQIKNIYSRFSNYLFNLIVNADHKYHNQENILTKEICAFLNEKFE